tara:strand:- start:30588 stop:30860 length:273 start_codon:yes stop_codon:yes gene_type:complete
MSNKERDAFVENVTHWVTELWTLEDRQDLLEDCVDYISNELEDHVLSISYVTYLELMLSYFQSISSNAISNTDLNRMAEEKPEGYVNRIL